jgi:hypothetical protein
MEKTLYAFCGLDCTGCPAFHASERLSMAERQKIADQWAKDFNAAIKATDIDCVGCTSRDGVHVGYCSMCAIRACALEKAVATCAQCGQFGCEKLEGFLKNAPVARENLAKLRA